jgi:diaminopimelate epimerase
MMNSISFYKYHGAGNDFILIDNRDRSFPYKNHPEKIEQLCDRHFGIGGDGLILIEHNNGYDFEMVYYNADGYLGSMCGNGGRCAVAFAHYLDLTSATCTFLAADGPHQAEILRPDWVRLQIRDITEIEVGSDFYFLDTGSPHYVRFVEKIEGLDVVAEGRKVRYNDRFKEKGTNVNFVEPIDGGIKIATYERGVENETLACGTGITAAAIASYHHFKGQLKPPVAVEAKGGQLSVEFEVNKDQFTKVWLSGPAEQVYTGQMSI